MKRRATGLLGLATVIFGVSLAFEARMPWLSYVRATAEAAMVGGVADWFAITALFRHPLGIPIPHTAIIPSRKDRIGRALGNFVQNNFLARDVVARKLALLSVSAQAARWLAEPANSRRVAKQVAAAASRAVNAVPAETAQAFIDESLMHRLRKVQAAPVVANALTSLTAGNHQQELLDRLVTLVGRLVNENEELIRDRIRQERPWWVPGLFDEKIQEKVLTGIERTLSAVRQDPNHPLRMQFDEIILDLIDRLRNSPETIARAESIKDGILRNPAVEQLPASLWDDLKRALDRYAQNADDSAPPALERGLQAMASAVLSDTELMATIDQWIVDTVLAAIEQHRDQVGKLIADTVSHWDADVTSQRIELQIGKDLQFVRINGTLVGGAVGLLLHVLKTLV